MATPNFCSECGSPLPEAAKFCTECGHRTQTLSAVPVSAAAGTGASGKRVTDTSPAQNGTARGEANGAEPVLPPTQSVRAQPDSRSGARPAASTAPPGPGLDAVAPRRNALRWIVPLAIAVVALSIGAVLLLTGGSDESNTGDTAYRKQVATVFGPVLGANQQLSRSLQRLGARTRSPQWQMWRLPSKRPPPPKARSSALDAPASESKLATDARQVLDREAAYLSTVSTVLSNPSAPAAGELQTVSSNLTSALSAAGPTVAGAAPTVTGTDRLTAWAPQATRAIRRETQRKARAAKRRRERAASSNGTSGAAAAPSTASSGRDCGSGLFAGPNTSCEFAGNVRDAYNEAPGARASVRVFSPVTGETYTMNCSPSGDGVTCSGANDASVTF